MGQPDPIQAVRTCPSCRGDGVVAGGGRCKLCRGSGLAEERGREQPTR